MKRHDKKQKITRKDLERILQNPARADERLCDTYGTDVLSLAWDTYAEGNSLCASLLCREAKSKYSRIYINDLADCCDRRVLWDKLCDKEPKMRKNTARLMGALCCYKDTDALIAALHSEKTRFVIPSLILALGAIGTQSAADALSSYEIAPAADDTEIKHEREEREALSKALSACRKQKSHEFTSYNSVPVLKLICASGMGKYAAADCDRQGINVLSYADSSVRITGTDEVLSVRSYREVLIPIGKADNLGNVAMTASVILNATHKPSPAPFRYRIEYRGDGDRQREISATAQALTGPHLVNSVSDYEAEVRITPGGDVFLKLYTAPDYRFSYRQYSLPASIAPANAAAVMSAARRYFTPQATVLDMCCGAGTMIAERRYAAPTGRLICADISDTALTCARDNLAGIGNVEYHRTDLRHLKLRFRVDEVISNLPFGSRVGTRREITELYSALFPKLDEWLKPGGLCVLYTTERKLVIENMNRCGGFTLLESITTEAGGLMPCIMIMRKDK